MELNDLFELLDKFEDSSLTELRIKTEQSSVVLKRGGESGAGTVQYPAQSAQAPPAQGPAQAESHPPVSEPEGAGGGEDIEYVTSPIVATFYRAPAPDAPPFVEEGGRASTGDTLCVLEAMKVMNELEAEFDLEVIRVLVQNGEMVEYGTPLLEVKRL